MHLFPHQEPYTVTVNTVYVNTHNVMPDKERVTLYLSEEYVGKLRASEESMSDIVNRLLDTYYDDDLDYDIPPKDAERIRKIARGLQSGGGDLLGIAQRLESQDDDRT